MVATFALSYVTATVGAVTGPVNCAPLKFAFPVIPLCTQAVVATFVLLSAACVTVGAVTVQINSGLVLFAFVLESVLSSTSSVLPLCALMCVALITYVVPLKIALPSHVESLLGDLALRAIVSNHQRIGLLMQGGAQ